MNDTQSSSPEVGESILQRISEAEVIAWLAARLEQVRATGLEAHSIGVSVRVGRTDGNWSMHARSECAACEVSSEVARTVLHEKLFGDAVRRAARLRIEAKEALKEAEELEALAPPIS